MSVPTLDAIKALNGLNFATLTEEELATLNFYLAQGRKYDIKVLILSDADPAELAKAPSKLQTDEIFRRANSFVQVMIGPKSGAAWLERFITRTH